MPAYPGNDLAKVLYENEQRFLFDAETVPAGTLSRAYQLRRERGASYPFGFSVELSFGGAPGVFEVDVMAADTDNADHFVPIGSLTVVSANNVARLEFTQSWVKYIAVQVVTLTNAVATSVLVTR